MIRLLAGLTMHAALAPLAACQSAEQPASSDTQHRTEAFSAEDTRPMPQRPPSASRPKPPEVEPIVLDGIRYQEDRYDDEPEGGRLLAKDAATGDRLWTVQVYPVRDLRAAGISDSALPFASMALSDDRSALIIANIGGGRYSVDLATREVTTLFKPGEAAGE